MLEFCGRKFTCDECPICEGVEHRLRAAREGGYEPQLEYCLRGTMTGAMTTNSYGSLLKSQSISK